MVHRHNVRIMPQSESSHTPASSRSGDEGISIFMFYLNIIYGTVEMVDLNGPNQKLFDT